MKNIVLYLNAHSVLCCKQNPDQIKQWYYYLIRVLEKVFFSGSVVVKYSFDDGYKNDLELIKVLKKIGVCELDVFVSPGLIDLSDAKVLGFLKSDNIGDGMLTWDDCKFLLRENINIGAHGCRHENFQDLGVNDVLTIIHESDQLFFNNLQYYPSDFALPFGPAPNKNIMRLLLDRYKKVYLSDNTKKVTTAKVEYGVINRRHMEVGCNFYKSILMIIISSFYAKYTYC